MPAVVAMAQALERIGDSEDFLEGLRPRNYVLRGLLAPQGRPGAKAEVLA